jgi:peptidoglycan/LPS O-acetylase OafA/YrhL
LIQSFQRSYNNVSDFLAQLYNRLASVLEGKNTKSNIYVLDGVRAIACLSVVMFHINLITTNDIPLWKPQSVPALLSAIAFSGDTGVTLFFVLSGFLLFLPYAKSLLFNDGAWPSTWQFYMRRALRILPVYYLSLFLMILFFRPAYFHVDHLRQLFLFLTMFMDSSTTTYKQINGPFWTLAVEWQFYLLLPWIALAISWLIKLIPVQKRFLILTCSLILLALWGIFTRFLGGYLTTYPHASFILPRSILNYILPFIYGPLIDGLHGKFLEDFSVGMFIASLYVVVRRLPEEHALRSVLKKSSPWLFIAGVTLFIVMAMWKLNTSQPHTWRIFDALNSTYNYSGEFFFALSYGLFVTSVIFGYGWLRRPFEWRPLRWIGLLSYSIYMWHLLLLEAFTSTVISNLPDMRHLIVYSIYWCGLFFIIVPLAFLLFILIEKPGMRLGKNFRPLTRVG